MICSFVIFAAFVALNMSPEKLKEKNSKQSSFVCGTKKRSQLHCGIFTFISFKKKKINKKIKKERKEIHLDEKSGWRKRCVDDNDVKKQAAK